MIVLPRPLANVPHLVHLYAVNVPAVPPVSAQSCVRASRGKIPCFADFMRHPYTLLDRVGGFPRGVQDCTRKVALAPGTGALGSNRGAIRHRVGSTPDLGLKTQS
jgi:hypothetical protein